MWLFCIGSLVNQLRCCMSVNCIMHFILYLGKELLSCLRGSVIIKRCRINVCYLLIKPTLGQTDFSNLLKQTVEVFYCKHGATIFQTLIIHDPAFDGVVLHDTIGPLAKLHCSLIIHFKADCDNHLKIIVLCITSHLTRTFFLNYSEIPNSCSLF